MAAPLRFVLNVEKAGQAAAYLLQKLDSPTSRFFIVKWLYLADRESLIRRGQPVTGDMPYSLPEGPILSAVLNFLSRAHGEPPREWTLNVAQTDWNEYTAAKTASDDLLAPSEMRILDGVFDEHGGKSYDELWVFAHTQLPEYRDPAPKRRAGLDFRDVLVGAGVPPQAIEEIVRGAALERVLAQASRG